MCTARYILSSALGGDGEPPRCSCRWGSRAMEKRRVWHCSYETWTLSSTTCLRNCCLYPGLWHGSHNEADMIPQWPLRPPHRPPTECLLSDHQTSRILGNAKGNDIMPKCSENWNRSSSKRVVLIASKHPLAQVSRLWSSDPATTSRELVGQ